MKIRFYTWLSPRANENVEASASTSPSPRFAPTWTQYTFEVDFPIDAVPVEGVVKAEALKEAKS